MIEPNQIRSFQDPGQAWRWACGLIDQYGQRVTTEDGQLTKEIRNLVIQVADPGQGWPIDGSGWAMPALDEYAQQLLSGENPTDFDYTYGERLRKYWGITYPYDQIGYIINKLNSHPGSRRCVATTWKPELDICAIHVPCLMVVDFLIRDEKLHLTAFFRSHDINRAWPQNVYGLYKLMEYVARDVGVETGSLTTVSASGHIYMD